MVWGGGPGPKSSQEPGPHTVSLGHKALKMRERKQLGLWGNQNRLFMSTKRQGPAILAEAVIKYNTGEACIKAKGPSDMAMFKGIWVRAFPAATVTLNFQNSSFSSQSAQTAL